MFGNGTRKQRHGRGRFARLLRLEVLERRDTPTSLFGSLHATAFAPMHDVMSLSGLTPAIIRNAYGFDGINFAGAAADGNGQTIAIVTAFDHPSIEKDLRNFNRAFNLPEPPSFTRAVVAGTPTHFGWAMETALDVQWAHAIAPRADLLLVSAQSDSLIDMLDAVDYARRQPGVTVVSMSWGTHEFFGQTQFDRLFTTPVGHEPVTFVAASGDSGSADGVMWPASSPRVLAVGGTQLQVDSSGNFLAESGWTGSVGGFSQVYSQVTTRGNTVQVGPRAVPDVSYAADPGSGFLVYNSTPDARGRAGWFVVGGTSAGAPQWAGLVAIINQGREAAGKAPITNMRAAINNMSDAGFRDVTTGSNGSFSATVGFDMVTGRGSPNADVAVAQMMDLSVAAPTPFVGPLQSTTRTTRQTTARTPALDNTTLALIQAAVIQQNFTRNAQLNNINGLDTGRSLTDLSRGADTRDVMTAPVLTTPDSTYSTWDESIRHSSGSTEDEGGAVAPAAPGGGQPGAAPAAPAPVAPAAAYHGTGSNVATRKNGTMLASRQAAASTATEDDGAVMEVVQRNELALMAVAFCFLGACFVGIEQNENSRRRPKLN